MKKHDISENASVGATSSSAIGGVRGSIFGNEKMVKRGTGTAAETIPVTKLKIKNRFVFGEQRMSFKRFIKESAIEKPDFQDVVAKLKRSNSESKVNTKNTIIFALEDEDGKMVKVRVPKDQAKEFESTLHQALDGMKGNSNVEIAELLYNLHLKFNFIDVEWPQFSEDEEEVVTPDENIPEEPTEDTANAGDANPVPTEDSTDDTKGALKQIVDLLKKDAEARTAEADAKKAEARAKEAEYTARASEAKIKQQEEVLDMETYNDDKSKEAKEAKELSQLAKYRHQVARDVDQEVSKVSNTTTNITSAPTTESVVREYIKDNFGLDSGASFVDFMKCYGTILAEVNEPTTDTANMDQTVIRKLSSMDPTRRASELERISRKEKQDAKSTKLKSLLMQKDRISQLIKAERDRIAALKGGAP